MLSLAPPSRRPVLIFSYQSNRILGVRSALRSPGSTALDVPWQGRSKQFFWKFYLGGGGLEQTSAVQAWSHFVPLKSKLPFSARNKNFKTISLEAFFYRHALALLITCRFCGQMPLQDAAQLAYTVKQGSEKFEIQQNGVPSPSPLDIESLAKNILNHMRESVLGKAAQPGERREVFTVFTVVSADFRSLSGRRRGTPRPSHGYRVAAGSRHF